LASTSSALSWVWFEEAGSEFELHAGRASAAADARRIRGIR
jgi:hypothetical protein